MQTIDKPRAATLQKTWDNTAFFSSTEDPRIAETVDVLKRDIEKIGNTCKPFAALVPTAETVDPSEYDSLIQKIRPVHQQRKEILKRLGNVRTYISTALSTDTQDAAAKTWMPILQKLSADLSELMTPFNVFLIRTKEDFH